MSCCNKPDIRSSTYSDWCENCGWSYDYTNNEESGSWNYEEEDE
jgi:hypothetical protein